MPPIKKKSKECFGIKKKRIDQLRKARINIGSRLFDTGGRKPKTAIETDDKISASKTKLEMYKSLKVSQNELSDSDNNEGGGNYFAARYFPVDVTQLSPLLKNLVCPMCHLNELQIRPVFLQDFGVVCKLETYCNFCDEILGSVETSSRLPTHHTDSSRPPFEVNRRLVTAFIEMGTGYAGMEKLCRIMDMPCLHKKTFCAHAEAVGEASNFLFMKTLSQAATLIRQAYIDIQPDLKSQDIINISVSFDGSWLTRGHKSHFGIGACIDILTGLVIDFQVMSSYCHYCAVSKDGKGNHNCDINFDGSAGGMEAAAAAIIWKRSVERYKFRYLTMLSDGDSKTFNHLVELNIYGDSHPIHKEECINHVGKRMGTALRKLANEKKGEGITLGGRGYGKLTDSTIKKLTRYYENAIRSNTGNLDQMRTAVFATLMHSISTDENPHHLCCPAGPTSWCFYRRAQANGEIPGSHKQNTRTAILYEVGEQIKSVYDRLGDEALLSRCLKGKTQNANESLHSVVWNGCPKTHFVHKERIQTAVSLAISRFNSGMSSSESLLGFMGIEPGNQMKLAGQSKDEQRIKQSLKRSTEKYKKFRMAHTLKIIKETENKQNDVSYESGNF